ncbi:hypothetical protein K4K48_003547 [Colletotrichum sp. SAR 10_66]|nr:hypothetical protein K4K48_003547 [Colletotrichum sp. SAR 10_66]
MSRSRASDPTAGFPTLTVQAEVDFIFNLKQWLADPNVSADAKLGVTPQRHFYLRFLSKGRPTPPPQQLLPSLSTPRGIAAALQALDRLAEQILTHWSPFGVSGTSTPNALRVITGQKITFQMQVPGSNAWAVAYPGRGASTFLGFVHKSSDIAYALFTSARSRAQLVTLIVDIYVEAAMAAGIAALDSSNTRDEILKAENSWVNYLFIMSISVAHEYVHILVGSLMEGSRPRTPLRVHFDLGNENEPYDPTMLTQAHHNWRLNPDLNNIPAGLEDVLCGEAGFAWEERVLGGQVIGYFDQALQRTGAPAKFSPGNPVLV